MHHLFKLRLYLKPYLWQILLNITFLLSVTGLALVVPQILQNVIDQGLKAGASALLLRSALLLASTLPVAETGVEGAAYEVVRDTPGKPVIVKLLGMPGTSAQVKLAGGARQFASATLDGKAVRGLAEAIRTPARTAPAAAR